jgi:hypothetical protein
MEVLAIIPARGGSKGIPRKNIRLFAGYPLIAWSIAAARQARLVTRTIVSTDDAEIAAVAREYGAEVPFLRPSELAQDQTPDWPVFEHACAGWMNTRATGRRLSSSFARLPRSARPGAWTRRCVSFSITPTPIVCAAWCRPGKIHSRCGAWTRRRGAYSPS